METFSDFKIHLFFSHNMFAWSYEIYETDGKTLVKKSDEFYESEGIARYAAIGHIHLMETNSPPEHS